MLLEALEQRALMAAGQVNLLAETAITQVFQNDGKYVGTRDTSLKSDQPGANFGTSSKLDVDGQPAQTALLQWDVSKIPAGSHVTAVSIQLNVTNASASGYDVYTLLKPWSETKANWTQTGSGASWQSPGAAGSTDRGTQSLGTLSGTRQGLATVNFNAAGIAAVQKWIDNPQANFGITIQNRNNTDGLSSSSREQGTAALRPKLIVSYTTDGTTTPPPTSSNSAPQVDAGPDQSLATATSVTLNGTVSDDGLPAGSSVSMTWTKVSGPGTVTFGNASAVDTTAKFSAKGTYVLRLTASDSELATSDEVTIRLGEAAPSGNVIRITGTHNTQTKVSAPPSGATIDLAGGKFYGLQNAPQLNPWPDPIDAGHKSEGLLPEADNLYPLTVKGSSRDFQIRGGFVQGLLDPLAPWHIWKNVADGDGLRVEGLGNIDVSSIRIDNVEDGFSPHTATDKVATGDVKYTLRDVYFTRIHDDMIENDALHDLDIHDVYLEGHTFFSARGANNPAARVTISNAVVQLTLQPHQGSISGSSGDLRLNEAAGYPFPDGLGTGSIWKLEDGGASGKIHIKDSVFLVPRASTSSFEAMSFNANNGVTYENVTVVWLGEGNYPDKAPAGVTITRDRSVFDKAKSAFFASHPQFTAGSLDNRTASVESAAAAASVSVAASAAPSAQAAVSVELPAGKIVASSDREAANVVHGQNVDATVQVATQSLREFLATARGRHSDLDGDGLLDLLAKARRRTKS